MFVMCCVFLQALEHMQPKRIIPLTEAHPISIRKKAPHIPFGKTTGTQKEKEKNPVLMSAASKNSVLFFLKSTFFLKYCSTKLGFGTRTRGKKSQNQTQTKWAKIVSNVAVYNRVGPHSKISKAEIHKSAGRRVCLVTSSINHWRCPMPLPVPNPGF